MVITPVGPEAHLCRFQASIVWPVSRSSASNRLQALEGDVSNTSCRRSLQPACSVHLPANSWYAAMLCTTQQQPTRAAQHGTRLQHVSPNAAAQLYCAPMLSRLFKYSEDQAVMLSVLQGFTTDPLQVLARIPFSLLSHTTIAFLQPAPPTLLMTCPGLTLLLPCLISFPPAAFLFLQTQHQPI